MLVDSSFPSKTSKMASTKEKTDEETVSVAKTPAELQRMRLEKLMKNPHVDNLFQTKPVYIPDSSKAPKMKEPPEFIRNVWGSSAGAGSGDFHVYRGVRRREYARQKFTNEITQKKTADEEYHIKVEENQKAAEERTAKKRAKRQKKKEKMKNKKMKKEVRTGDSSESEEEPEEKKKKEDEKTDEDEEKSSGADSGDQAQNGKRTES